MIDPVEKDIDEVCAKRFWTLSVLSDENPLGCDATLPLGLRFHLSRCPSCSDLADRLMAVNGTLTSMASAEPDVGLLSRANEQAWAMIQSGQPLAGSLASSGVQRDLLDELLLLRAMKRRRVWRSPAMRYATAAVIGMALILAGQYAGRSPDGAGGFVDDRGGVKPSSLDGLSGLPDGSPAPAQTAFVEVGPPASAAPGSQLSVEEGTAKKKGGPKGNAFQRAWVPGRDYGSITGQAIDNGG